MEFYEDLPKELQPLFPLREFPAFPEAIRQLLSDGWHAMKPNYQRAYEHTIHSKKGLNRVLYASDKAVKALMENPRKDTIAF